MTKVLNLHVTEDPRHGRKLYASRGGGLVAVLDAWRPVMKTGVQRIRARPVVVPLKLNENPTEPRRCHTMSPILRALSCLGTTIITWKRQAPIFGMMVRDGTRGYTNKCL
jgi:hypothetical protein